MTSAQVKSLFFDRQRVIDAMDRKTRGALSRVGAFVRTRARSGLRKRKAVSDPGSPPSMHEGAIRRLLFFSYDPSTRSVVIGPAKYRRGNVPQLLEEGGDATIVSRGKKVRARYQPRPFMGPSLQAELKAGTIPSQWGEQVGGRWA